MQVIVDGLLTDYESSGSGDTILILHGWGDRASGFTSLRQQLAKSYRVISPDLPGFGSTQAPGSVWGLNDYASFVQNFLAKLGVSHLYAVIGHSNGGAIALRALAAKMVTSDKLVLIASAGIRGEYKGRIKLFRYITKAGKFASSPLPQSTKRRLRRIVYKTVGSDMLVVENLQETFKKVIADDVRPDAAQITIPVLLIYGQNDESTPTKYGDIFHALIKKSQLLIVPGADHFVHLQQQAIVFSAVSEFLG